MMKTKEIDVGHGNSKTNRAPAGPPDADAEKPYRLGDIAAKDPLRPNRLALPVQRYWTSAPS
jgi:hypothetical protein